MNLIDKIFKKKKEKPVTSNIDFWKWFSNNEERFFQAVKNGTDIDSEFFDKLAPRLNQLKEGYFFLTGMYDENTVELIITPDGDLKNIAFAEELVEAAPKLDKWKFTALKPPLDIKDVAIKMYGFTFSKQKLSFYSVDYPDYPDEIEITIVHDDLTEENRAEISNGIYIFLDNYLGELNVVTIIDKLNILGTNDAEKELIPIEKLKDYIIWREKEFIEKYEGYRNDTINDIYSVLEATQENGKKLVATINTDLLDWERKASHPWILIINIKYKCDNPYGMPDNQTFKKLDNLEKEVLEQLKDSEGYLYIGRQTADNLREVYFACKDFRKPSKVAYHFQKAHESSEEITFEIFKDKYWISFERFESKN